MFIYGRSVTNCLNITFHCNPCRGMALYKHATGLHRNSPAHFFEHARTTAREGSGIKFLFSPWRLAKNNKHFAECAKCIYLMMIRVRKIGINVSQSARNIGAHCQGNYWAYSPWDRCRVFRTAPVRCPPALRVCTSFLETTKS